MEFTKENLNLLTDIRDVLEEIHLLQEDIGESIENPKSYLGTLREVRDTLEEIHCLHDDLSE